MWTAAVLYLAETGLIRSPTDALFEKVKGIIPLNQNHRQVSLARLKKRTKKQTNIFCFFMNRKIYLRCEVEVLPHCKKK